MLTPAINNSTGASRALAGRALALAFLTFPTAAAAFDFSLEVAPAVAIPLSKPQSDEYNVGGGEYMKAHFGLTKWLDIGPTASFLLLPAEVEGVESGIAWGLGGGLRLKRPHDGESGGGVSPWVSTDLLYVRTGPLNRVGLDAAVGLSIPAGPTRNFWVGPFAQYRHVFQGEKTDIDGRDAKILSFGIAFEGGPGRKPDVIVEQAECPPYVASESPMKGGDCSDGDKDGVPDCVDICPDVVGVMAGDGCPVYTKVIVKRDRLELREKIMFAWDEATFDAVSLPLLDEVAQALKDNKSFKVQIEGHADSSGSNDYNQGLSERRAMAVLDYLADHGVAKDRLVAKGFSSSEPAATNQTAAGREDNRRVEFIVSFMILK